MKNKSEDYKISAVEYYLVEDSICKNKTRNYKE
jgi:hypothetical protein